MRDVAVSPYRAFPEQTRLLFIGGGRCNGSYGFGMFSSRPVSEFQLTHRPDVRDRVGIMPDQILTATGVLNPLPGDVEVPGVTLGRRFRAQGGERNFVPGGPTEILYAAPLVYSGCHIVSVLPVSMPRKVSSELPTAVRSPDGVVARTFRGIASQLVDRAF